MKREDLGGCRDRDCHAAVHFVVPGFQHLIRMRTVSKRLAPNTHGGFSFGFSSGHRRASHTTMARMTLRSGQRMAVCGMSARGRTEGVGENLEELDEVAEDGLQHRGDERDDGERGEDVREPPQREIVCQCRGSAPASAERVRQERGVPET
eukprot:1634921-Rhodomonas_salina.1